MKMRKGLYYFIYFFIRLVTLLPMKVLYLFSSLCYYVVFYVMRYRYATVHENLRHAFPEKTPAEIQKIIKDFYRYFCDVFIEVLTVWRMDKKTLCQKVRFLNSEVINQLYEKGLSCICVTGHTGNWELASVASFYLRHKLLAIYKPLRNKQVDALMRKHRSAFGAVPVAMHEVPRKFMECRRNAETVLLYAIADQRPAPGQEGCWLSFFGRTVPVITGWARLACRYHLPVVYMDMQRTKRGHYEVSFSLLSEGSANDTEEKLLMSYLALLETSIRKNPACYLWSHKRWKYVK